MTWNHLINSKSVENQKKLQLQKLFQITLYFYIRFMGIFLTPSYFFGENSILGVLFSFWKRFGREPLVSGRFSSARACLSKLISHVAPLCGSHKRESGHMIQTPSLRFLVPVHLPIAPIPIPTHAPAPSTAAASTSDVEDEVGYEVSDDHHIARERCERAVQELLQRRRAYAMVVPTNDSAVRARLCRLGEPITLFGEHEMERCDPLCELMVHLEAEGKDDLLLRMQVDDQAVAGGVADPIPLLH
jgi:hypothetical protein